MNLLNTLRDFFGGAPRNTGPSLRNRAGGMAWIKGLEGAAGAANGQVVRTLSIDEGDFWLIDPQPHFIADRLLPTRSGMAAFPGDSVQIISIRDGNLVPIGDTGVTREEVKRLYLGDPNVRKPQKVG
jgi:hypothetical protein